MDNFVGSVTQPWFWKYFFSHLGWVDWGLLIFLLVGTVIGLKNGMSQELPRLFETLLVLLVTLDYHGSFAEWLARETPLPDPYARALTFGLTALGSWLALRLLFEILGRLVRLEVAAQLQMTGGILIGGLRYFLFFTLISYFLTLFPLDWIHQSYQVQSWSGQALVQVPLEIQGWVKKLHVQWTG